MSPATRSRARLRPGRLLLGAAALAALAAPGAASAATPVSVTFTTPGESPFVVPGGVRHLQIVAVGGQGGTGQSALAPGGFGARVTGEVAVTPGQVLYAEVGANGAAGTATPGSATGGGGAGGAGGANGLTGGGGGGASAFQTATSASAGSLASRLIVAGGGGGSAGGATSGAGGGAAGVAGAAGSTALSGGGGGTTTAGGTAGAGTGTGGTAAAAGVSALGGTGASGGSVATSVGGGGGGGGYFGGGGGGSATTGSGGGGGGGASFTAPSVTGVVTVPDTSGTPSVTVTYTAVAIASLSPGGLIFPARLIGTTGDADAVTVTNTGSEPLTVTGTPLSGADPGDFALQSECTAALAPGAACRVLVRFTPRAAGTRVATLTVTSTAADGAVRVLLTGAGTAPPPPPPPTPAISGLAASPGAFRAAPGGGSVVTNPSVGTRISFRANVGFTSTFTVQRATPGVRAGTRCVAPPRRTRTTARGCVRWVGWGNFSTTARAGANGFRFSGRVWGRTLAPGTYRLSAVPRSGARIGNAVRVGFRIIR